MTNPGSMTLQPGPTEDDEVFVFPCSFAQKRLWFLDQFEPGSPLYNLSAAVRLTGALDLASLTAALQEIVARHESLRTTFAAVEGEPMQLIHSRPALTLPCLDLRAHPAPQRDEQALQRAREEAFTPFSLADGPLIRATLLQLDAHVHVLLLTLHHIIADGWSIGVLLDEVAALYGAFTRARPSPLDELPIQYADYAEWQRTRFAGNGLAKALDHFSTRLRGAPALLTLPTDRPRPAARSLRGASHVLRVGAAVAASMDALARHANATPFMVLTAVFGVLLGRHANQHDICIGTPVANRNRAEIAGLIGFFVNTLVLRVQLARGDSLASLLARVRDHALDAFAYQDLPFERLVEALQPERSMSHTPLFQAMLVLQNAPAGQIALPGVSLEPIEVAAEVAKFDLTLSVTQADDGLICAFEYATDLFDAGTIERMAAHFVRLLTAAVSAPQAPLASLPMLDANETRQLLDGWNPAGVSRHRETPPLLHASFEAHARATPDAPALIDEDRTLSYGQLDAAANRLAHRLRAAGAGADTLVAICALRSFDMVVALLGTLKAGAAYLPLDPSLPPLRLAYVIDDARPAVLLSTPATRDCVDAASAGCTRIADRMPVRIELDVERERAALPDCRAAVDPGPVDVTLTPANLAYVIYTSGSTGRPKGVAVPHEGIVNRLRWMQSAYALTAGERVLQKTPFGFDVSVWEFFWTLSEGASLVLARPDGHLDPQYVAATIAGAGVGTVHFVPPMLALFLDALDPRNGRPAPAALRRVICSGQALPPELATRCAALLPHVELHNLYGPTEASVDVSAWPCDAGPYPHGVPIGQPIDNLRLYVLDADDLPVPAGATGHLHIAGIGLARGYLDRAALTAASFVPDPFGAPGTRMYRTGDLARHLSGGEIVYLGRIDHQVKLRGLRIELGEIEAALTGLDDIRQACVMLREDTPDEPRLIAYLVTGTAVCDIASLREQLRPALPDYMLPADAVVLDALPLTANGKIDRAALPAPGAVDANRYVAPRSDLEAALARIWSDVLNKPRVGIDDDFFRLGGHSLLATQAVAKMRAALDVELSLRSLFETPTIARLAARLESATAGRPVEPVLAAARQAGETPSVGGAVLSSASLPALSPASSTVLSPARSSARSNARSNATRVSSVPPLLPTARGDGHALPLSFGQQRLWFLTQLDPHNAAYHMPLSVRLRGTLDTDALARALNAAVERHEALRTTFPSHEGEAVQRILPSLHVRLLLTDLRASVGTAGIVASSGNDDAAPRDTRNDALPTRDRDTSNDAPARPHKATTGERVKALAREAADQPFDLAAGPLLRASLLRIAEREHVLLLTLHHIVADGWSLRVLIDELAALYRAFAAGRPSPLAPLALHYADYAGWQRNWLRGSTLDAELQFWRGRLAGAPDPMPLPVDRPRAAQRSTRGATHSFTLSAALGSALRTLCDAQRCTLFVALLSGFHVLLHRRTGAVDTVIGTDVANRNRVETAGMLGFFVNQIVTRARFDSNPDFAELLAQTHEFMLDAQAHQDVPFDKVVEALNPRRTQAHHPVFQVKLAFQNVGAVTLDLDELELEVDPRDSDAVKECDLTLFLSDSGHGIDGMLEYNADLFDAATVAQLMDDYASLLADAAARPGTRADRLALAASSSSSVSSPARRAPATLTTMTDTAATPSASSASSVSSTLPTSSAPGAPRSGPGRFKAVKPVAVTLPASAELVRHGELAPGRRLPLVIEPAAVDVDLADWARLHRDTLDAALHRHGAVLFRGFGITTPIAMERVAAAMCGALYEENGEHPHLSGRVYEPVFFPPTEKLLWHNENTFNDVFPRYIWFACARPADSGGETPLVDSRAVHDAIDPAIRERFQNRGVRYVRNYRRGIGLSWQEVFGTTEREQVEAMCRASSMQWEWKSADHLRTSCVRPGVIRHPATGESSWINQAQHWHVSCLDHGTREALSKLCSEAELPRHCYYGDGSPIGADEMAHILAVYERHETSFDWQSGDLAMLDNILTAHARNPFSGRRGLMVTMGDMVSMSGLPGGTAGLPAS